MCKTGPTTRVHKIEHLFTTSQLKTSIKLHITASQVENDDELAVAVVGDRKMLGEVVQTCWYGSEAVRRVRYRVSFVVVCRDTPELLQLSYVIGESWVVVERGVC